MSDKPYNQDEHFAVQQLIGFRAAEKGVTIEDLVLAMDLSKHEWEKIKEKEKDRLLEDDHIQRLDKFFEED